MAAWRRRGCESGAKEEALPSPRAVPGLRALPAVRRPPHCRAAAPRPLPQIKRCDEMARQLRFFTAEVEKAGIPVAPRLSSEQVLERVFLCVRACVRA